MSVVIETTLGDITVDLYLSERPRACLNFLKLCKIKYYNYNLFHTISRGFIAQTGDPTGTRSGGESLYGVLDGPEKRYFEGENEPRIKHTKMGLISFVGNEEHMIGSQFFLTLGDDLTYLDQKHCVFGEVVEGLDILECINEVICDTDDRPYKDVRITHTAILDDPYPDPKRLLVPSRSPSPSAERLKGGRIAPDEDIDETEGKTVKEIVELRADREAKARATILEMVGDLPDAEMAPPENVLFVCKLNPVTTDDDLEIIFNRFGQIVSCEVIRDRKTGDSLQYAFIEFADREACEGAYFKMDNILIDDRRIHVDFSQSVSKVKWLGKGKGVAHFDEKGRKTTRSNTDIGKGNYKVNPRERSNSPRNGHQNQYRKGRNDSHKENHKMESSNSRAQTARERRERTRSPQRNVRHENNSRRDRNRSGNERSWSPRKQDGHKRRGMPSRDRRFRSRSRSLTRRTNDTRGNRNADRSESRREDSSRRRLQDGRSRRRNDSNRDFSTSRTAERDYKSKEKYETTKKIVEEKRKSRRDNRRSEDDKSRSMKHKKKKSSDSGSDSSDGESEKEKSKKKKRKRNGGKNKKPNKRKRKESTDSSSDSDSDSESSESEEEKVKSKKRKKISNENKKRKSKRKESSDSSDSSDSSESESSSESSEEERKKSKKRKKKSKDTSDGDSSESDKSKSKKRKKRKH